MCVVFLRVGVGLGLVGGDVVGRVVGGMRGDGGDVWGMLGGVCGR